MATKPTLPPSIWAENRPTLPPTTDSQWGQGFEYTSTTSGGKALTETFDYPLFKIDESLRWLRDLFDDNGVISGLPDATETQKGVVEKATTDESESGVSDKFPDAAGVVAAISAKSLGTASQNYTDVSSVRQAGVVYTNTDTAPRFVNIVDSSGGGDNDRYQVRKDSSSAWVTVGRNSAVAGLNVGFIVPPGFQYRAKSLADLIAWSELSL